MLDQATQPQATARAALEAEQASGERLVSYCRVAFGMLALVTVSSAWTAQTRAADLIFAAVSGLFIAHGALALLYLRKVPTPWRGLKYVTITLDLLCLFSSLVASSLNYSGVYEVFRAPGPWLLIALFNGLGALRYSPRSSLYAAALTLALGAATVAVALHAPNVPWVERSAFVGEGLNLSDCVISMILAALPATFAAVVASNSQRLVLRTVSHALARDRAEDRQRQILDSMADMILVKGADSKILWANRALREAWGLTNAELVGTSYGANASQDEQQRSNAQHALVVESRDTVLMPDERLVRTDGRVLQVDTVTSPIFDVEGEGRDDGVRVARRERPQETAGPPAPQRDHVQRRHVGGRHGARDQQSADLRGRQPGISVGALAQVVPRRGRGGRRARQRAGGSARGRLARAAHRQRSERCRLRRSGAHGRDRREADARIDAQAHRQRAAAPRENRAQIREHRHRERQPIAARPGAAQLLLNASQAIREGAADENEVRVSLRAASQDRVAIEVSDTGRGIAEEHLPHLFDPFFTTKDVGEGTGLGLFICHRIVTEMGGTIEVESRLGQGAIFRVLLPAATRPSQRLELVPELPKPVRRGRILVVDDDTLVARALSRLLAAEHDVVAMTRAEEALNRLKQGERFDMIFCDLMMPVTTGQEFHERLRSLAPEQAERTIFITGGAFTDTSRKFLETTDNDRLEKPFDRSKLDAIVARYVNSAA